MSYPTTNTIGIYVAEEQELFRQIYKSSIEMDLTFKFIGISAKSDEESLLNVLASEKPDVLLMGTKRLDNYLFQQIEHICAAHPGLGIVLLLTAINDSDSGLMRKLIQKCHSGIAIYLKQSLDNPKQLHDILTAISRGQVIFDPKVAGSIMKEKTVSPFIKLLTDRELEILNLLSIGYTNQSIAKALCIDIKTVAHHLNNIYSKLKADDRLDQKHPRVSVARLYLETTGELMPIRTSAS
jgi:two-component system, NarL family, vancomycin resistance associated response regulator VraR